MSTSVLYHTFGVSGVQYKKVFLLHPDNAWVGWTNRLLGIALREKSFGQRRKFRQAGGNFRLWGPERFFSVVPNIECTCALYGRTVNIPRLYCKDCGTIRQPHLAFADPKKHYTRSLERFVIDLCRVTSIQNVAELTGLGWDMYTPETTVSAST